MNDIVIWALFSLLVVLLAQAAAKAWDLAEKRRAQLVQDRVSMDLWQRGEIDEEELKKRLS